MHRFKVYNNRYSGLVSGVLCLSSAVPCYERPHDPMQAACMCGRLQANKHWRRVFVSSHKTVALVCIWCLLAQINTTVVDNVKFMKFIRKFLISILL